MSLNASKFVLSLKAMIFPHNKQFAFSIIDDTDGDNIDNTKPVYDLLDDLNFRTTKTVWAFSPRDKFKGLGLENYRYRGYIKKLQKAGFEIALHGVGSGKLSRREILQGLELFRRYIGDWPKIQINHGQNPDNLYWGFKRFSLLRLFGKWSKFQGENPKSKFFWGDLARKNIKFIRNFTFKNLNLLKTDPFMPYRERDKKYANYWFSSTEAPDVTKFNKIINRQSIDRLSKEKGVAIIYTHFAEGFVKNGRPNRDFRRTMEYLASQNGYFAPASELLEYLLEEGRGQEISPRQKLGLELKWLVNRLFKA